MNQDIRKDRGPYRQKDEIAFWYPVSHDEAKAIERAREFHKKAEGYAPPQFQMLGRIIRSYDDQIPGAEDLSTSEKSHESN